MVDVQVMQNAFSLKLYSSLQNNPLQSLTTTQNEAVVRGVPRTEYTVVDSHNSNPGLKLIPLGAALSSNNIVIYVGQ